MFEKRKRGLGKQASLTLLLALVVTVVVLTITVFMPVNHTDELLLLDSYRGETVLYSGPDLDVNHTGQYVGGYSIHNNVLVGVNNGDLMTLDLTTFEVKTILSVEGRGIANAIWSPDGSRIAFENIDWDPADGVYVVEADGSNLRKLTDDSYIYATYTWYDNENVLLSLSNRSDTGPSDDDIFLVNVFDPSVRTQLTFTPATMEHDLSVSVDGSIAFFTEEPLSEGEALTESYLIWVIDQIGDTPRLVVVNGMIPKWSPDGEQIAYTGFWVNPNSTNPHTNQEYLGLGIVNADGSGQRILIESPNVCFDAQWGQSNLIYFYECMGDHRVGSEWMQFSAINPVNGDITEISRSTGSQQFYLLIRG